MFQFIDSTAQPQASSSGARSKAQFDPASMDQDLDELFDNATVAVPGEQIADASEWMRSVLHSVWMI